MRPFVPIVRNPHLLTILSNFWPRNFDFTPWPMKSEYFQTEPDVQVLIQKLDPPERARGAIVMVHGLEGSGEAGYIRSMSHAALEAGLAVRRFHMRTCGGTERLCQTLYHAGLTSDLLTYLRSLDRPAFLVGFSLGGNVVLKLAGELGDAAHELIAGVCAISTPIDLAACAVRMTERDNRLYQRRFVNRMRERVFATGRFTREQIAAKSLYTFDDQVTAPSFGFRNAAHYYETQSANRFLESIRVPALLIQAKDDSFIPFEAYKHPAFRTNRCLQLIATDYGGHLGFLSRDGRRFWVDETVIEWIVKRLEQNSG